MSRDAILVVDDSLTVRMDLADAFERSGFQVFPCATAAEARQTLARQVVDLAVLDVLLPDADGTELLAEIRSGPLGASLPVLMLSSEAEVKDRVRGLRTGADEYVGKPYDTGYVIARTRQLLRQRKGFTAPLGKTILVIDDSLTFREELRGALEEAGYGVLVAAAGEEGLRLAGEARPDGIVVDGILPGMDGATVVRKIRLDAALRGTPCVLLTGSEDRGAELRALDAGADTFVRKDEEVAVILARLGAAMRGAAFRGTDETDSLAGPKRILAVDDSMTYLEELASVLRGEGYDVVSARSGEEALDMLAAQPVDCILLDMVMPGLSGQETCRRIRGSQGLRDVPLIMLTALEDRSAMIEGLRAGADDYISKSGEFEILKARVRAQMRRKQFEDENRRIREELLRTELEASEARAARTLAETRAALVEELERKNRDLEAFSYSVSHDLRAPLRSIDGFSQVVLSEYGGILDERGRRYLERVRVNVQRMGELIDDLLALARVGRADVERQPVSLSDLARDVMDELERREPTRTIEIVIHPSIDVEADPRLMRVALENLLSNAWKFTAKSDSPRIEVGVQKVAEAGTSYFVRDNGAGFDMKHADKLFSPFQRLHRADEFPGTGIGLATVQRVMERHGGRIWVDAALGRGATFHFTIPRARQ